MLVDTAFWGMVDRRTDNECWPWQGHVNCYGYGRYNTKLGGGRQAHRFAYESVHGKVPDELVVRHQCDNKVCVNPGHLIPGTQAENTSDMVSRGRSVRGERQHKSKMTVEGVKEVRRLIASGITQTEVARRYEVSLGCINDIHRRKNWYWV